MGEKFTMKKKWHIVDSTGVQIGVAGLSFTPLFYKGESMFLLAWVDIMQKQTIAELFDNDGNGLSLNHFRLENVNDEPKN